MKHQLLLVLFAVLYLTRYVFAYEPIDLDKSPNEFSKTAIIVAQVPASDNKTNIRTVVVERVLSGDWEQSRKEIRVEFYDGFQQDIHSFGAGCYVLLLQFGPNLPYLGKQGVTLGPVTNYLKVKSVYDPEVSDIQTIIDTATIAWAETKWHRLDELRQRAFNRPLIAQYVVMAQANMYDEVQNGFCGSLFQILHSVNKAKYTPATYILADRMLAKKCPEIARIWIKSPERKALFEYLKNNMPDNDDYLPYVKRILKEMSKETTADNEKSPENNN